MELGSQGVSKVDLEEGRKTGAGLLLGTKRYPSSSSPTRSKTSLKDSVAKVWNRTLLMANAVTPTRSIRARISSAGRTDPFYFIVILYLPG